MSDSFGLEIKSETLQVAQSHDRRFAADGLERRDVGIVAYAARSDHRDSACADALVECDIRSAHRAVTIDSGDVQSNDSRVNATLESFVDTQPSRCQPTADLDLIVAHVEG